MVPLVAALLTAGAVAFTLFIRAKDIPEEGGDSSLSHLEDKKARIYEALRDLSFEYRVGKLSEEDYQKTKLGLQQDLAKVTAQVDGGGGGTAAAADSSTETTAEPAPAPQPGRKPEGCTCPHCGATFPQALRFCGECGKPIQGEAG